MFEGKTTFIRLIERKDCSYRTKWVNDKEVINTLMFDWPLSTSGTEKWFDTQNLDPTKKNFIIETKDKKILIGMTGLIDTCDSD